MAVITITKPLEGAVQSLYTECLCQAAHFVLRKEF